MTELWASIAEFFAFDTTRALEPNLLVRYGIQLLLLCGSAFFSSSETAFFALTQVDLQQLRKQRHRHAETLQALLDEPRRLIVSILCGNELVNSAAVANMTGILVALYGEAKAGWIAVLVMLPLLLLVGEVTPKTIAESNARRLSSGLLARPVELWIQVVTPLRWLIRAISDRLTTWIVGPGRAPENLLRADELRSLVEDVAETGDLDATGRMLINNSLSAGATEIVKIMVPRSRIFFLDADREIDEVLAGFRQRRHLCAPVYRGHRDNLVGFLHAEDVIGQRLDQPREAPARLEDLLRRPVVVPLTKRVDEMFAFFQRNQARAAAVLNEFGGVAGFITISDVLRFIFGDLLGQAPSEPSLVQVDPDAYEVAGDTKLGVLQGLTGFGLDDPRMTTVAGVAFRHLDRLPAVGDTVLVDDLSLTVLEMDAHRIARLRVARAPTSTETRGPADQTPEPDPKEAS